MHGFGAPNGMRVSGALKRVVCMNLLSSLSVASLLTLASMYHMQVSTRCLSYTSLMVSVLLALIVVLLHMARFPMEIGTPLEDQFGLQTPSIAESPSRLAVCCYDTL